MLNAPFRFRSGCHLRCVNSNYFKEDGKTEINPTAFGLDIVTAIQAPTCEFNANPITDVYYPANKLFSAESANSVPAADEAPDAGGNDDEQSEA
jgi:hypothetical protein